MSSKSSSSSDEIEELFRDCGDFYVEEATPNDKVPSAGEELMEVEAGTADGAQAGGTTGGGDGQGQPNASVDEQDQVGSVVVIDVPAVAMVDKLRKEYEGHIEIGTTLFEFHSKQLRTLLTEMRNRTEEAERLKIELGLERKARGEQGQGSSEAIQKLMEEIVLVQTKLRALEENHEEEVRNMLAGIEAVKLERNEKELQLLERIDKGEKNRAEEVCSWRNELEAERRGRSEFELKVLEKLDNFDKERKEEVVQLKTELEAERSQRRQDELKLIQKLEKSEEYRAEEVAKLRTDLEAERMARKLLEERSMELVSGSEKAIAKLRAEIEAGGKKDDADSPVAVTPSQLEPEAEQKIMDAIYKLEKDMAELREEVKEGKQDRDTPVSSPQPQQQETVPSTTLSFDDSQFGNEISSVTEKVEDLSKDVDARLEDFGRNQQSLHEKVMNLETSYTGLRQMFFPQVRVTRCVEVAASSEPNGGSQSSIDLDQSNGMEEDELGSSYDDDGATATPEQRDVNSRDSTTSNPDESLGMNMNETDANQTADINAEKSLGTQKRTRTVSGKAKSKAAASKKKPPSKKMSNSKVKGQPNGSIQHARDPTASKYGKWCICGKKFRRLNDLTHHINNIEYSKTVRTKYPCHLCNKVFFLPLSLEDHLEVHERIKADVQNQANSPGRRKSMYVQLRDRANPNSQLW